MTVFHPKLGAILWLTLMLVFGLLSYRLLAADWLETGFLALLPAPEQEPAVAQAIQRHDELRDRKIIWLIGGASAGSAVNLARLAERQLRQSGLFGKIQLALPGQEPGGRYRRLFPYRYQLLDKNLAESIRLNPDEFLKRNLATLYNPLGQLATSNLEQDPLMLFSRYFSGLNTVNLPVRDGVAVLQENDTRWALMLAELQDAHLQLDRLESLLALSKQVKADTEAAGGAVLMTGMPLFTASGADSAKGEISTVGLGSSAAIILVMLITFRSPRPLLLSSIAIGSGLFAALLVSIVVFGKVHIITLVFGASLIGVADDYALHFVCDSFEKEKWRPAHGLRYLLPGLLMGLAINLLSYLGLVLSPFPGLQEVALFSAVGLLMAWLTVVLLFPLALTGFQPGHKPLILKWTDHWQQRWPAWMLRHRKPIYGLLALFIISGIARLEPKDDVRLLQSANLELLSMADKIKSLLPLAQENQFFLITGETLEDWRKNEQALLGHLQSLIAQRSLSQYQALSELWPDTAKQNENYALLNRSFFESGRLKAYMKQVGFPDKAFAEETARFQASLNRNISLEDWLGAMDDSQRELWLGCGQGQCRSVVNLSGIRNLPALAELDALPGVAWIDQPGRMSSLFARYRVRIAWLIISAYVLVFGGLGYKFGWKDGAAILSIPVLASLFSLAMTGWFGQLFSLFNLFALLLVLGVGVDDAIFFYMAGKNRHSDVEGLDKRASTSLAVVLSAITTLLAFGLLALSSTEIVHAFGFTVACGIMMALLLSPVIGYKTSSVKK